MNQQADLVSVVMPTFNSSRYMKESIESVLNQTYSNLELLLTDDYSTDQATKQLLKDYMHRDPRVRIFLRPRNVGPAGARNYSIKKARGRYIAFCDSDDRWMPEKLERQLDFMKAHGYCLVYSAYLSCDHNGKITGIVTAPSRVSLSALKRDNKIGCLTAIYDTRPYGKVYMPLIRKRQDWALFLKILKQCKYAYGIKEPLAYYRNTPQSVSHNKVGLLKYNAMVYRKIFGYSITKAYTYLYCVFLPCYLSKILHNKIVSLLLRHKLTAYNLKTQDAN